MNRPLRVGCLYDMNPQFWSGFLRRVNEALFLVSSLAASLPCFGNIESWLPIASGHRVYIPQYP